MKMNFRFGIAGMLLALPAFPRTAISQAPAPSRPGVRAVAPSDTTFDQRLIREIRDHQTAVSDVEYLSDVIGPRLTGSPGLAKAYAWAESTMTARGMTGVHREAWDFGPSWTRGRATARLVSQSGIDLDVAAYAWTPATKGTVRGEVITFGAPTMKDLQAKAGHFKGKIVLAAALPAEMTHDDSAAALKIVQEMTDGALAYLMPSGKALAMTMSGTPNSRAGMRPKIPTAIIATEHYDLLNRLLARGMPVTVEINLPSTTSAKPVQAFNIIGEIRGSEKPDEVVIIGAHMDSWDLATGATDNGTGTAAVLEALRAIKVMGVAPKRTIRGILFSGEEEGDLGSHAYVAAHTAEMPNIQAVLIDDLGTGRINGWSLQRFENARPLMAKAIAPLNELGVTALPLEWSRDSDHAAFTAVGVPAFFGVQDVEDYFTVTHHSQFDTFSHVKPDALIEGATAFAVTAWELANMDERLPHN